MVRCPALVCTIQRVTALHLSIDTLHVLLVGRVRRRHSWNYQYKPTDEFLTAIKQVTCRATSPRPTIPT